MNPIFRSLSIYQRLVNAHLGLSISWIHQTSMFLGINSTTRGWKAYYVPEEEWQ